MTPQARSLLTARLFEFYVRNVWPVHRIFAKGRLARRCVHCAASERMVSLGPSGVCRLCSDLEGSRAADRPAAGPIRGDAEREFSEILKSHEGKAQGRYDALALFSGGKDSTYMIRRIQTEFPGLRLLAYTIDNNFMSPIARENVEDLVGRLRVDHVWIRPSAEFSIALFRYCLTHLNADGGYGTLDFTDGEFMLDTARQLAAEKGIPLILCGYSRYQVQNGLHVQSFESPREAELTDRVETAGLRLSDIFSGRDLERWWRPSRWSEERVARLLFPLFAWDLEEKTIQDAVETWGLLNPKRSSPIVTNHALIPVLGVVDVHRSGYSSFEPEFCRMIREGKAQKRDWQPVFELLEYSARTGFFVRRMTIDLLDTLGLTLEDVGVEFSSRPKGGS